MKTDKGRTKNQIQQQQQRHEANTNTNCSLMLEDKLRKKTWPDKKHKEW